MTQTDQQTILLVEDEALIALNTIRVLARAGYRVLHARSGEEALELALTQAVDLVLMDINLGQGMDGAEAARQILAQRDLPLIFLSSHTEREVVEKAEQITSYGYVVKNSNPTVLFAAIKMAFRLRQAHEDLRLNAEVLRQAQQIAHIGHWVWEVHSGRLSWSDEIFRIFGVEPGQFAVTVENFERAIHPDDLACFLAERQRMLETESQAEIGHRIVRPDGEVRYVVERSQVLRDGSGAARRVVGTVQDISERRQAQLAQLEAEQHAAAELRVVLDTITVGICRIRRRKVVWANRAHDLMLGYAEGETCGLDAGAFHPDKTDFAAIRQEAYRLLNAGQVYDREMQLQRKDGSLVWCRLIGQLLNPAQEEEAIWMVQDISVQRQMAQELQEQRDFATQVLNLMGQGVTVTDAEGRFVFANPAYGRLFGYSPESLLGRRPQDVSIPEDVELLNEQRRLRRQGRSSGYETRLLRADGEAAPVWVTAVPRFQDGCYTGAIAVISDLSQQKQAERQIQALLHEKESLLREVHHRIKNNMQTIASLLQLQADAQQDPAVHQALQDAGGRVRSMLVLYDRLYRSESTESLSLSDYLPPLLTQILELFPNQGQVRLETDVAEIELHPRQLYPLGIILNELATNAMKYAFGDRSDGLIRLSVRLTEAEEVDLLFCDNGRDLPADFSLARHGGFGLQLVALLSQQLRGWLQVENRSGGACFHLRFPLKQK